MVKSASLLMRALLHILLAWSSAAATVCEAEGTCQAAAAGGKGVLLMQTRPGHLSSVVGTEKQLDGQCQFALEPEIPYYWEPTCSMGMLGCWADGVNGQCRFCGMAPYTSIECPPTATKVATFCQFDIWPVQKSFWDPTCAEGTLGCLADGKNVQCRFCGDGAYASIPCPTQACQFPAPNPFPHFWDPDCREGKLGCLADGVNPECRYCSRRPFESIPCPFPVDGGKRYKCNFATEPDTPYHWDMNCKMGMLGCWADGLHAACRFCGKGAYASIACPPTTASTKEETTPEPVVTTVETTEPPTEPPTTTTTQESTTTTTTTEVLVAMPPGSGNVNPPVYAVPR